MPPDPKVHVGVAAVVRRDHDLLMLKRAGVGQFASDGHDEATKMMAELALALGFEGGTQTVIVKAIWWNDHSRTTKEEVLARLDEAIARTAPAPEDPLPVEVREEVAA